METAGRVLEVASGFAADFPRSGTLQRLGTFCSQIEAQVQGGMRWGGRRQHVLATVSGGDLTPLAI